MTVKGHSIFLSIAGFIVKVHFHKSIAMFGKLPPEEVQKMMMQYNEGFILKEKQKCYDFQIEMVERGSHIYHKKGKQISVDVFREEGNNLVVTNTHISRYQFVYILRYIINKLIVKKGFILHSSANLINQKATIYCGPSGAGKSTIVSILKNSFPILSDDECYIKKEGNSFYYYQGPFLEKNYTYVKNSLRYQIGNLYLLHKASHCKIKNLSDPNLLVQKVANQIWIGEERCTQSTLIKLSQFIGSVGCYSLLFSKEKKDLLDCISKHSRI